MLFLNIMAETGVNKSSTQRKTDRTKLKNTVDNQKRVFKIIVVGDSNVGKTCLTYRFCEGKFLDKSEATIGVDFRERTVDINGEEIKVSIKDVVLKILTRFSLGVLIPHSCSIV
jgi:GTPase SAR1 family protein